LRGRQVDQKALKYVNPTAKAEANAARAAFGADYEATLRREAGPQPDRLARRKHQISSLYHQAKMKARAAPAFAAAAAICWGHCRLCRMCYYAVRHGAWEEQACALSCCCCSPLELLPALPHVFPAVSLRGLAVRMEAAGIVLAEPFYAKHLSAVHPAPISVRQLHSGIDFQG
jgi:hypothetical protein